MQKAIIAFMFILGSLYASDVSYKMGANEMADLCFNAHCQDFYKKNNGKGSCSWSLPYGNPFIFWVR